jgi:hypothetical protein
MVVSKRIVMPTSNKSGHFTQKLIKVQVGVQEKHN